MRSGVPTGHTAAHQSSDALPTHAIGLPSLLRPQCGSSIEVSCPSDRTQIRPYLPCLPGQRPASRAASPSRTAWWYQFRKPLPPG